MKLQLKRSNVLDLGKAKEPTPPYVEYGELCVNYNTNDPALFIKDSNDNIIRIAGKNSVGSGSNPSGPDNPNTGNNIGDVFFNTGDLILYYWDGNEWVPIASQKHAADIYVGTFAEVDVEIPEAERRNGLLLWETEEGNLFLWYMDADTSQWVVAVPGGGGGGGGSNVTVLDVAPNNPKQGDLWYCTLDGRLYIYYEDVNTSQWVDASPDNLSEGFWERDGTTLKPIVAGDGLSAATGAFSGTATGYALEVDSQGTGNSAQGGIRIDSSADNDFPFVVMKSDGATTAASFRGNGTSVFASGLVNINNQGFIRSYHPSSEAGDGHFQLSSDVGGDDTTTFRIEGDGKVLIGGTLPASPNITLRPSGEVLFGGPTTNTARFRVNTDGVTTCYRPTSTSTSSLILGYSDNTSSRNLQFQVTCGGRIYAQNTSITQLTSERRFKENIAPIDSSVAWETIKATPYYSYNFKGAGSENIVYGPMADEVPAEMVIRTDRSDDVGVIRTYDNGLLQARLYTALRTALTRIEALEAEVQQLKGGN